MPSSVGSSLPRKEKKKHARNIPSKSKQKRLQKKSDKTSVSNIDLFGNEKNMELTENIMDLLKLVLDMHQKILSSMLQKMKLLATFSDKSKVENQVYAAKVTPTITSSAGYGLVSDAVLETVAPLVIEQNWICCDKCQKWRLLPYGHNPDKIPKKWLCSILDWLPGMNSCDISEEETDRAAKALYQVHVPESQNSLNTLPDHGAATGITLDGLQCVDKTHQGGDIHGVISREIKNLKVV